MLQLKDNKHLHRTSPGNNGLYVRRVHLRRFDAKHHHQTEDLVSHSIWNLRQLCMFTVGVHTTKDSQADHRINVLVLVHSETFAGRISHSAMYCVRDLSEIKTRMGLGPKTAAATSCSRGTGVLKRIRWPVKGLIIQAA